MKILENLELRLLHYSCDGCFLNVEQYDNGRIALEISALVKDEGDEFEEPVAVASVNLPDAPCAENEVYVKNYSENAGMVAQLVRWGVIEPTVLGRVASGYVMVDRFRLTAGFVVKLAEAMLKTQH